MRKISVLFLFILFIFAGCNNGEIVKESTIKDPKKIELTYEYGKLDITQSKDNKLYYLKVVVPFTNKSEVPIRPVFTIYYSINENTFYKKNIYLESDSVIPNETSYVKFETKSDIDIINFEKIELEGLSYGIILEPKSIEVEIKHHVGQMQKDNYDYEVTYLTFDLSKYNISSEYIYMPVYIRIQEDDKYYILKKEVREYHIESNEITITIENKNLNSTPFVVIIDDYFREYEVQQTS